MDQQTITIIQGRLDILNSQENASEQEIADMQLLLQIAQSGWKSDQAVIAAGIQAAVDDLTAQVQTILNDGSGSDNQIAELAALFAKASN